MPKESKVYGKKVYIKKIGHSIITLKEKNKWDVMRKVVDDLAEFDFDRNQPDVQNRDMF
jgi:hypothetical protein